MRSEEIQHLWRPSPLVRGVWDLEGVGCVLCVEGKWNARSRSGQAFGPFDTLDEAKAALEHLAVSLPRNRWLMLVEAGRKAVDAAKEQASARRPDAKALAHQVLADHHDYFGVAEYAEALEREIWQYTSSVWKR